MLRIVLVRARVCAVKRSKLSGENVRVGRLCRCLRVNVRMWWMRWVICLNSCFDEELQCDVHAATAKIEVQAIVACIGMPGQVKRSLKPDKSRRKRTVFMELESGRWRIDMHERSLIALRANCQACAEQLQEDMEATLFSHGFSAECVLVGWLAMGTPGVSL